MTELISPAHISFVIGIIGTIFGVYHYFKNPQVDMDKRQAVSEREINGKAVLLAEQVKWEREANDKRFLDMQANIKESHLLASNHIHTVDVKVDALVGVVNNMNLNLSTKITELVTKIEERRV